MNRRIHFSRCWKRIHPNSLNRSSWIAFEFSTKLRQNKGRRIQRKKRRINCISPHNYIATQVRDGDMDEFFKHEIYCRCRSSVKYDQEMNPTWFNSLLLTPSDHEEADTRLFMAQTQMCRCYPYHYLMISNSMIFGSISDQESSVVTSPLMRWSCVQ